jgi:hypothetical protein
LLKDIGEKIRVQNYNTFTDELIIVNAFSINNHLPVFDEMREEEVDVTQMQKTLIGSTSISTALLRTLVLTDIKVHLEIKISPSIEQQIS